MSPANPLSTVGLMLTLASLLGSFFYLHLSQWVRDVIALDRKQELNEAAGTDPEKRALVECRIELKRLWSWPGFVVNGVVIAFVIFVLVLGLNMIHHARTDPLYRDVQAGLIVFLIVFVVLSGLLLAVGIKKLTDLSAKL